MNDDLLIQHYLDGRLTAEDLVTFQQRLREDADLREHLRCIAEQAVAFGDLVRREMATPVVEAPKAARFTWLALAASIALLAASAWLFFANKPDAVLTLVESTGTVAWSDGTAIETGETLPAGTLETVGEASSALLRFEDGSLITLHGEAELSFASEHQKMLSLSRGTLSAEVRPQPEGHPMLIRTPSAVAEVVGTAFDLSARSEDTLLKVDEGMVKLKRLADGSQVDVPAQRSAVASLETDAQLAVAATPEPLTQWAFDFTTSEPPRDWRGFSKGGVMHASPYVAKKMADGRIITHFGISVRTAMLEQPLRLLATNSSVIRYRLRQDKPGDLQFMLLTHQPEGGFGGNFECRIQAEELQPAADGWCEVVIPVTRCKPVDHRAHIRERHPSAAGNIITSAIISSFRDDRHLEVIRFELGTR